MRVDVSCRLLSPLVLKQHVYEISTVQAVLCAAHAEPKEHVQLYTHAHARHPTTRDGTTLHMYNAMEHLDSYI